MLSRIEFQTLMGEMTGAWSQKEFGRAFSLIEKVLDEGSDEMKAEALFFRGTIRQASGENPLAREDWLKALAYAQQGSFLKFNLELQLGRTHENEAALKEALAWYRKALKTCADGEDFSGEEVLSALLRLMDGRFPEDSDEVTRRVVRKSWRVLDLPGTPDEENLEASTTRLREHMADLVTGAMEDVDDRQ